MVWVQGPPRDPMQRAKWLRERHPMTMTKKELEVKKTLDEYWTKVLNGERPKLFPSRHFVRQPLYPGPPKELPKWKKKSLANPEQIKQLQIQQWAEIYNNVAINCQHSKSTEDFSSPAMCQNLTETKPKTSIGIPASFSLETAISQEDSNDEEICEHESVAQVDACTHTDDFKHKKNLERKPGCVFIDDPYKPKYRIFRLGLRSNQVLQSTSDAVLHGQWIRPKTGSITKINPRLQRFRNSGRFSEERLQQMKDCNSVSVPLNSDPEVIRFLVKPRDICSQTSIEFEESAKNDAECEVPILGSLDVNNNPVSNPVPENLPDKIGPEKCQSDHPIIDGYSDSIQEIAYGLYKQGFNFHDHFPDLFPDHKKEPPDEDFIRARQLLLLSSSEDEGSGIDDNDRVHSPRGYNETYEEIPTKRKSTVKRSRTRTPYRSWKLNIPAMVDKLVCLGLNFHSECPKVFPNPKQTLRGREASRPRRFKRVVQYT